ATDELAKGINEEVVRAISAKRNEPEWMLEFRLNAYRAWLEMEAQDSHNEHVVINGQNFLMEI
ncbi:FeS cluster assembly protein sufB, partial [Escherichia coli 97.0007]